jgi:hypothetical protein
MRKWLITCAIWLYTSIFKLVLTQNRAQKIYILLGAKLHEEGDERLHEKLRV